MFKIQPFVFFYWSFFTPFTFTALILKEPQTFILEHSDGENLMRLVMNESFSHRLLEMLKNNKSISLTPPFLQYIGSLEVGRPSSRMEIVAAMRRIRVRSSKGFFFFFF